ncbi:hypothetical protein EPI10_021123 [Gossypium australe]|uniref:RVP_2 domain-containing protein n=1 Tax=Gossypium australe TaxID=47621 RepID=A0A5B6WI10_9ROSI|nr:hypothetical protein EPI10_021123 [Gossypium australe]
MNEQSEVRKLLPQTLLRNLPVEFTQYPVKVTDPLVNHKCKSCPLKVRGYDFLASLMLLPFDNFEIILGMDWLFEHDAIHPNCEFNCARVDGVDCITNVVSALSALKFITKGHLFFI